MPASALNHDPIRIKIAMCAEDGPNRIREVRWRGYDSVSVLFGFQPKSGAVKNLSAFALAVPRAGEPVTHLCVHHQGNALCTVKLREPILPGQEKRFEPGDFVVGVAPVLKL